MCLASVFIRGYFCVSSFLAGIIMELKTVARIIPAATKGVGGVLLLWGETENSTGVVFNKDELLDEYTDTSLMQVFVKLSWQLEVTNRFLSVAFLSSGAISHLRNPVLMSDVVSDFQSSLKSLVKFVLLQLIGFFQ